jgi:hypothetical protein
MADDQPKIEVTETVPEVKSEPVTEVQLKDEGMSVAEIDLAKKHNVIAKEPEKKEEEPKKEEPKNEEIKQEETKKDEEKKPEEPKLNIIKPEDVDPKSRWLFNEMKNERRKRQEAQAEKDQYFIKLRVLEKENEQLKTTVEAKQEDSEDLFTEDKPKPVEKRVIEPDETDIKQIKARRLNDGLRDAELDGKMKYTDFDEVNVLANEVLNTALETFKGDKKTLAYVRQLHDEMMHSAYLMSEGKDMDVNRTIADIAYELGTLHPKYGKKESDKSSGTETKKDADSKVERVLDNAKVRTTSAALGGSGGKTFITEEDLTPEQAAKLPEKKWFKLKRETRERILRAVS